MNETNTKEKNHEEAETLLTNLNGIGARCAPLYTFKNYGPYHLVSSSETYMKPKDISARAHETEM